MPALRMAGLSAGYGEDRILSDITLSLSRGEICGLIGPNGAGKSTLLRGILGLGVHVEGTLEICGIDVRHITENQQARMVSFLPQNFNPFSRLTVAETVLLGRHPYRSGWAGDSERDMAIASECMRETDTWELRHRQFFELSGGEKRLVLLASALAQQPDLLLLDEPGSSLDFRHQLQMWLLLEKLTARGIAVLVSTHEVALAGSFLHTAMVLHKGRAAAMGEPAEVFSEEILSLAFGVDLRVQRDRETGSWIIVPGMGAR